MIVTQPFFCFRGTSFSVYHRARVMANKGIKVDILTYGSGDDIDIPGIKIIRIPKFSFLGPVKVGPSFKKAFLNIFILLWTIALLIKNRYLFVHAHEESAFFAAYLKKIFGFKFIYDMHSSLPEQLSNFKFTNSKMLINIFKKLEKKSLKEADSVITICPELEKYILPIMPDQRKSHMIENSVFENIRLKSLVDTKCSIFIPPGKDIILYAGTFEKYQGIDLLISSFKLVLKKKPNAFLLLIGGSEKQVKHYKRQISQNVAVYPRVPISQISEIVQRATLQVSPRIEGKNTPLKIYEQLANGTALIATNIFSHTQVLTDRVCFLVDPTPEALANGIVEALNNQGICHEKIKNAQALYKEKYSKDVYERKIAIFLETLR